MCRQRAWLALCLAMLFLTACSTAPSPTPSPNDSTVSDPAPGEEEAPKVFTLAYSRSDSLDPFKMTTRVNRELGALLYEGLTTLDESMHAQNALAESVSVSDTTVVATLRADAVFSDGSTVTAADVVTSFEAAKASDAYAALLSGVDFAAADENDPRTVTFTFAARDPYAAACLCFPVVRVNADGTVLGSGPYVFDHTPRLVANPHAEAGTITEIRLLDLVDDASVAKGLDLGNISYFFSNLADGEVPRVSSATAAVPMNCMVFLGVNSARTATANSELRQALSLALDRQKLVENAFAGYAQAATTTFLPAFAAGEEYTALATTAERDAARDKLAALGYTTTGATTTPSAPKPKTLSLTLLVNGDNGFKSAMALQIKEQLAAVGVTVTVEQKPFAAYQNAVKWGQYDLCIGEVRLCENMDLSPLLTRDGAAAYGVSSRGAAAESYAAFCAGTVSFAEFTAAFAADLPYIPVCFRCGMAAYDRSLTNVSPTAFQAYAGLKNWQSGN